ncbi:hypothetical protein JCM33374_g6410 [Metschnikowia sp. JCM 33374]|nr:hypothetical protein JCM33374_g6410 [Metschnikowia sp. JCM 33374]
MSEPVAVSSARGLNHGHTLSHWAPFPHFSTMTEFPENPGPSLSFRPSPHQNIAARPNETSPYIARNPSASYHNTSPNPTASSHDSGSSYQGKNHNNIPPFPFESQMSSSTSIIPQTVTNPPYGLTLRNQVEEPDLSLHQQPSAHIPKFDMLSFGRPNQPTHNLEIPKQASTKPQTVRDITLTPQPQYPQKVVNHKDSFTPSQKELLQLYQPQRPSPLSQSYMPGLPQLHDLGNQGYHSSVSESARRSLKNTLPISHITNTHTEAKTSEGGEALFSKLVPLLQNVNKSNFERFLVEVLKECHNVPIDDLYNLLYNEKFPSRAPNVAATDPSHDSSCTVIQKRLKLCHFVVEAFKGNPDPTGILPLKIETPEILSVNFHELLRSFLALKILFGTLQPVETMFSGDFSLPRTSIYKVYYILCQKLIAKYPTSSNSLSLQQNIILGQSKMGKLMRLAFPDLVMKRLGKRGHSKYNYVGFQWNYSVVDEDILNMLDLEVPEIQDTFNDSRRKRDHTPNPSQVPETEHENYTPKKNLEELEEPHTETTSSVIYQRPAYSFVDLSGKYPSSDCAPRIWKSSPNTIPSQSKWAKDTMDKSVEILRGHSIDLDPLIQNFNAGIYSDDDPHGLSKTVTRAMERLFVDSSCGQISLHLYLAILLLIFPVIIASDQEVASSLKRQLQASLRNCITKFGCDLAQSAPGIKMKLGNFTSILKKMLTLNQMASVSVRTSSPEIVLQEIVNDVKRFVDSKIDPLSDMMHLEESFVTTTIHSFNAYNYDLFKDSPEEGQGDVSDEILAIAKGFASAMLTSTEIMQSIPLSAKSEGLKDVTQDLPHQIFKLSVELFHDLCLNNSSILRLPFPIINYVLTQTMNEMQNFSFNDYRKRDAELSKEVFRSWWVFATMFQEYLQVISEVLALSQLMD